jgi:glutamate 5-kinase
MAVPPTDSSVRPRDALASVRSVVVKLGTQLLSRSDRTLDTAFIAGMAGQIAGLRARGVRVTVVSSGAVGAGMSALKLGKRPTDLATLQAVAAIGQPRLLTAWSDALAPHGLSAAQILLTREDVDDRTRFLNLRNTLTAAERLGAVPVINENDTVSTDEIVRITFGDNDILAALVAQAIQAELLVLLTVVDGLLDAEGKSIRLVERIEEAQGLVRAEKSAGGKGGMDSKLRAAQIITGSGERLVIAHGRTSDVLGRVLSGEAVGTLFLPSPRKLKGRNRWITSARAKGTLTVDAGAATALVSRGKSLLPAGVTKVSGEFAPGDPVDIVSPSGEAIARGLSNYASAAIELIKGRKTADLSKIILGAPYDEVIHRDNLVLLGSAV